MIRKEIHEYMSSSANIISAAVGSIKSTKTYPPVKVLPDSHVMRIIVTGGSGFVGSHLVDRWVFVAHVYLIFLFFTLPLESNIYLNGFTNASLHVC